MAEEESAFQVVTDEAALSVPAEPCTEEDAYLEAKLLEARDAIGDCVCLAANQIGVNKAAILYCDDDNKPHVLFNPKLLQALYPYKADEECLSLEGQRKVTRFNEIRISYDELVDGKLVSRKRKFFSYDAELIHHCIDHCKGKLI